MMIDKNFLKKMKKSVAKAKKMWYSIKRSCREGQANKKFEKS